MNFNRKFIEQMFRQVDNVVWDIMSGRVGFKSKEGIVTIELGDIVEDEAPDAQVSVNMFEDFGISIPAFAQSVPVQSITLGDMIFSTSGPLGWVVKKNEKSFKLMKPDGTRSDWSPPKVQMIGIDSGVMVLRNLINMFPGGSSDLGSFQNSLMPLMMLSSDDNDISKMLPFVLMGQMGGDGNNNMLQMMMMMQLMGNKSGGSNFFDRG